jgi:hypothetical protein
MPKPRLVNAEDLCPGIRLSIFVDYPALVLDQYDRIDVHRSDTLTGTFVEITSAGTRPALAADQDLYPFSDTAGTTGKFYKARLRKTASGATSDFSAVLMGTTRTYVSLAEVRAAGVTTEQAADAEVLDRLWGWQNWIEEATGGQWFEPRAVSLLVDGNDIATLDLPVPIISVRALYMNGDFVNAVSADDYRAYTERLAPADRLSPWIALVSENMDSIYRRPASAGRARFRRGAKNQKIVGTFGYIERDGSTPFLIRKALLALVQRGNPFGSSSGVSGGFITKVQVDKSARWYQPLYKPVDAPSQDALVSGDSGIASVLRQYRRAPIVRGVGYDIME